MREILAITGKPGLYKIVTHSGKTLIVEDLVTGKRFPVSAREKVVSLGDIAMYTEEDDKPLGEILDIIYAGEKGGKIDVKELVAAKGLKAAFEKYVPEFDKERVHDSDIKKLFSWYNLLIDAGFTKFTEEEKEEEKEKPTEEEKKEDTKKEEKSETK